MSTESVTDLIKGSKAVFFDHDDTLVATRAVKWAHHKHVADRFYGRKLSDDDIKPHWGKPFPELVCLLYGTDNVEEALANNASCHEDFPKQLFPETIFTLHALNKLKKLLGIVTATTRFSFEYDLTSIQFPREIISYTQTSDDTAFHKPNPKVFDPAIAWLAERHIKPNDVVYIGDGLHDYEAAKGAGFNFIGVETGLVSASQFSQHGVISLPNVGSLVSLY